MAYGHAVPLELDTFLNTVMYPVEVPEYALPKHPAFESGQLQPFFLPDKNSIVLSRMTIATMIDLSTKTIPYKILHAKDIIEIYKYVKEYISRLSQYKEIEEAAKFLVKVRRFEHELIKSLIVLSRTDPKAMTLMRNESLLDLFKTNITIEGYKLP